MSEEIERDYLAEAVRIILQERTAEHPILMLPEHEHLIALWRLIPTEARGKLLFGDGGTHERR